MQRIGDFIRAQSELRAAMLHQLFAERRRAGESADEQSVARINEAFDAAIADAADRYTATVQRELHDRDERFRRLLDTLPVAVWIADAEGTILFSNESARQLWGGEALVSLERYDRYRAWFPDGRRVSSEDWGLSRALRTREVVVDEELRIETFDGESKVIRNAAAPIVDEDGRLLGGVAINQDITQLKRSEEARDQFVGILGHDLRSPLNAIALAAGLILERGGLEGQPRRAAERIQSSAARIQQLTDDLLEFARARFGTMMPMNLAAADMGDLCAHIVDEARTIHPHRTIRFGRKGDLRGVWDSGRVAQVLSNLVGNALQHGQDPIDVEACDAGEVVIVSVSNRGTPIPVEQQASLFEPFRKGAESEGLGLGLFIASENVRSLGGTIEVTSTDDATTFTTRWSRVVRATAARS
jgi:PAS domain S-box-containing protein